MSATPPTSPPKPSLRSRFGAAVRRSSSALNVMRPPTPGRSGSISEDDSASFRNSARRRSGSGTLELNTSNLKGAVSSPTPIMESPIVRAADMAQLESMAEDVSSSKKEEAQSPYDKQAEVAPPVKESEVIPPAKEDETPNPWTEPRGYDVDTEESKGDEVKRSDESTNLKEEEPSDAPKDASSASSSGHHESLAPTHHLGAPGAFVDTPEQMSIVSSHGVASKVDTDSVSEHESKANGHVDTSSQHEHAPSTPPRPAPGASLHRESEVEINPSGQKDVAYPIPTSDSGIDLPLHEHDTAPHVTYESHNTTTHDTFPPGYFTLPMQTNPSMPKPNAALEAALHTPGPEDRDDVSEVVATPRGYFPTVNVPGVPLVRKVTDPDRNSLFSFGDGAADGPELIEDDFRRPDLSDPFADPQAPVVIPATMEMPVPPTAMPVPVPAPVSEALHVTNGDAFNETLPLLGNTSTALTNSSTTYNALTLLPSTHLLAKHGWVEYALPDGSTYYVQPVLRIVTDVNLRSVEKVHKVLECLKLDSSATESHSNGGSEDVVQIDAGAGVNPHAHLDRELWLREVGRKGDEKFVRWWVDHRRGTAGIEEVEDDAEDRLDTEYRYWTYMEAHPAHISLTPAAKSQALEALAWAYTDSLLPNSNKPTAPPFTQDECQQLMNLLRSFTEGPGAHNAIQARIVSKILIRVGQWKQANFRPSKPLPQDALVLSPASSSATAFILGIGPAITVRRIITDLFVTTFCFGLPYMYLSRESAARYHHHYHPHAHSRSFTLFYPDIEARRSAWSHSYQRRAPLVLGAGMVVCLLAWVLVRGGRRAWRAVLGPRV